MSPFLIADLKRDAFQLRTRRERDNILAMKTERWLPIKGFEGLYEVSDGGRVRSVRRDQMMTPVARMQRGRLNRLQIVLSSAGTRKVVPVHRLVLNAFSGPPPAGFECCHEDGNATNNTLENLRWASRTENMADAKRHGTLLGRRHAVGSVVGGSKLTEADVLALRASRRGDGTSKAIVERTGASWAAVCSAKRGQTWSHVK